VTTTQLTTPEPVELLAADEVSALVAQTQRDLASLEQRVADARAAADALEERARAEGADERASTWAIVRLQRFIDGLREEAERDAETVVEAARRRTRLRIDPLLDHPVTTKERPQSASRPPVAPPPGATPVPPTPTLRSVAEPASQLDGSAASLAVPIEAPVGASPPASSAPTTEPPSLRWTHEVPAAPAGPAPAVAPAPSVGAERVAVGASAVSPTPAPLSPAPPPPSTAPSPRPKKQGLLRGFPLSAVLEVIAVLLVLLFILLRLS
jgi:hypothetical protein